MKLEKFANGEIYARYDETVRGADVFLIQSVAGGNVNDLLMELLIATDAAKRASARSVTAVITHYGYARQDRKAAPREPITARLVANLLSAAGADRSSPSTCTRRHPGLLRQAGEPPDGPAPVGRLLQADGLRPRSCRRLPRRGPREGRQEALHAA